MLLLLYQKTIPTPSSNCVIKTKTATPVAEQGTGFNRSLVGSAVRSASLVPLVFIFQENQTVEARKRQPDVMSGDQLPWKRLLLMLPFFTKAFGLDSRPYGQHSSAC